MTSKTSALKEAQSACGKPIGSRTSWVCYVPYYDDQPSGPSTELRADSYTKIVQRRANKVAAVALALMGVKAYDEKVDAVVYNALGSISAKAIIDAVLADSEARN